MFASNDTRRIIQTFTRPSDATLDGQTVGPNVARFPSNSGIKGALVEEGTTNLLRWSEDFTNGLWVKTNLTAAAGGGAGPNLANSVTTVASTSTNPALYQSITVTPGTVYTFSFPAKNNGGTVADYAVWDATNLVFVVGATSYFSQLSSVDFTTIKVSFTAPAGCTSVRVYCVASAANGVNLKIAYGQAEAKAYPTTYFPTTTATATRAAETLTVPTADLLVPSAGSVIIETYVNGNNLSATPAAQRNLFSFSSGGNRIEIRRNTAGVFQAAAEGGGAFTPASWNPGTIAEGVHRYCLGYDGTGVALAADGLDRATATPATPLASVDFPMGIGCLPSGFFQWNSPVQRVWFYARKLSSAERAAATAGNPPSDFTAYIDYTGGTLRSAPRILNRNFNPDLIAPVVTTFG